VRRAAVEITLGDAGWKRTNTGVQLVDREGAEAREERIWWDRTVCCVVNSLKLNRQPSFYKGQDRDR